MRLRLITKGITPIYGGDLCTYSNPAQFFCIVVMAQAAAW
jgi:copper oxidase (laccase) domain-containing protein